ncbi:MAG: OsmC family protein [Candidatus Cloacimonetes bacterium]|nr:OsmC family protein [Candidatus Cloacimonadota bacterium]
MVNKAKITWKGNVSFEADLAGHKINIDSTEDKGGNNTGPSPMLLLLPALAGCSSFGVVGILKKMRITEYKMDVEVVANKTSEHPQIYDQIELKYNFSGENLDNAKLMKAVTVAEERFCGVYAMLAKTAAINSIITNNGVEI